MINWTYQHFTELNTNELYQILTLRSRVFVVEQDCVYLDLDEKDCNCWHLCGWVAGELAAYARVLAPGVSYEEASIGRVVTSPNHRKKGYGIALMQEAIQKTRAQFNTSRIKIGAQCYLIRFYGSLGFEASSEEYIEDAIPHIEMLLEI